MKIYKTFYSVRKAWDTSALVACKLSMSIWSTVMPDQIEVAARNDKIRGGNDVLVQSARRTLASTAFYQKELTSPCLVTVGHRPRQASLRATYPPANPPAPVTRTLIGP